MEPTFEVQGNRWEDDFQHQSGFDQAIYQQYYRALRLVPCSDIHLFSDRMLSSREHP